MKAFLILEDGTVFTGTSIGSTRDCISEIVFNTSMTGYLEVLTDPSYAGQAVVMTYPLIGNYGITPDMESKKAWPDGYIVRELSRMPSNFRCEGTIQDFLKKQDIPGIAGIDTRALTKILREKGTMNGMITTNENYDLGEILPKLKAYTVGGCCLKVTCSEKYVLEGEGAKVALLDLGAKNNIAKSLNQRGCEVTVYPAHTTAGRKSFHQIPTVLCFPTDLEIRRTAHPLSKKSENYTIQIFRFLPSVLDISSWLLRRVRLHIS